MYSKSASVKGYPYAVTRNLEVIKEVSGMFKFEEEKHGLRLKSYDSKNITAAALTSLKIALISYFETYHVSRNSISIKQLNIVDLSAEEENAAYSTMYQQKYLQTIFHFHHFFELLTKDVLRSVNPLYAVKIDVKDLKVLKSIQNGKIVEDTAHSVEFETAMQRIISLEGEPDAPHLTNIYKKDMVSKTLKLLNNLRNRAWHRGLFILKYSALDQFITQNVLPLIIDVLANSEYKKINSWKYKESHKLSFDPINELITEGKRKEIDYSRIAFYKAVGLACYKINKFKIAEFNNKKEHSEKDAIALVESRVDGAYSVNKCFVCEKKALVSYREDDFEIDEEKSTLEKWWYIYKAECRECNLLLYNDLDNPKIFGINLDNLWLEETVTETIDIDKSIF